MAIKKVCVFCASSQKVNQIYFTASKNLAIELVKKDITIYYGGGATGLMGILADTVLANKGQIIGVLPLFMKEANWWHREISKLILVKNMAERKKKLLENTDAVIALPGGCGTLDELIETITLKQLGLFTKPIIIININGFFDPLIFLLDKMIQDKFMHLKHKEMWSVIQSPENIIEAIVSFPEWNSSDRKYAVI